MNSYKIETLQKLFFTFLLLITASSCLRAQTTSVAHAASRETAALPHLTVLLLLPGQETSGKAADGLAAYFSKDFDNAIGDEDSYKFTNPDENIGILRNGKMLSIEGRKPVAVSDTLPLKIWKLYQTHYTLKVDVSSFSDVNLYLHDSYLNSTTKLDNNAATMISFNLNSDAGSIAPDRFRIFLENTATLFQSNFSILPVELTGVKVYEKNKGVEVAWTAENESNIDRYEVEQSLNARVFSTVGIVGAKNNPGISAAYSWFDPNQNNGERYYRVKSFDKSGAIKYSPVVKLQSTNAASRISVATNPGANAITVFFKNSSKGNYQLRLLNNAGQSFYAGNISHPGGSATQVITMNNYLPKGIYHMAVFNEGSIDNVGFLVQ